MRTKENLRQVLYAIIATVICLAAYKLTGRYIAKAFTNEFVSYFIAQLFFAAYVTIALIVLKKLYILKPDNSYMKKGWSSAGFMIFVICFYMFWSLANLATATAAWWEALLMVLHALLVGYCEEVLFRGLIQRSLHDYIGERTWKDVFIVMLISGFIFGAVHLTNGLSADVGFKAAAFQAAVTSFMGMYLGAIYFRTGKNLPYVILLHGIYDLVGFIMGGRLNNQALASSMSEYGSSGPEGILFWGGIYLLVILFVLRPKKVNPLLSTDSGSDDSAAV